MSDPMSEIIPPVEPEIVEQGEAIFAELVESGGDEEALKRLEPAIVELQRERTAAEIIDGFGRWYLRTELELAATEAKYKPISKRMESDIATLKSRMNFISICLKRLVPTEVDYVSDAVRIGYKPSEATVIDKPEKVPVELTKIEYKPVLSLVKAHLEEHGPQDWAHVEHRQNISVTHGGIRARENVRRKQKAKKREEDAKALSEVEF